MNTAKQLLEQAYREQLKGELDNAIRLYRASIELHPTAEAHTFLGWVYSLQYRYQDAIAECLQAIAIDDTLGNPYNDIGAYLIELDRWQEAIIWLERAIRAPRYESRSLPYINLARVYNHLGKALQALNAYHKAWQVDPRQTPALDAYQAMVAKFN